MRPSILRKSCIVYNGGDEEELRDEPWRIRRDLHWSRQNRLLFILKIVKLEVPGLAKEDKEHVAEEWEMMGLKNC